MAEVVSCWQLTAQAGALIDLTPVYAKFGMERVALGQIFFLNASVFPCQYCATTAQCSFISP
jgi:hypothetical protein